MQYEVRLFRWDNPKDEHGILIDIFPGDRIGMLYADAIVEHFNNRLNVNGAIYVALRIDVKI